MWSMDSIDNFICKNDIIFKQNKLIIRNKISKS